MTGKKGNWDAVRLILNLSECVSGSAVSRCFFMCRPVCVHSESFSSNKKMHC